MSIEATPRGFAFAVLEGEQLVDWGGHEVTGDVSVFLDRLDALIRRYRPDVLVLEEPAGSRRGKQATERLAWAEELAAKREVASRAISRKALKQVFASIGRTKVDIARAVAQQFPELAPQLPRKRSLWEGEARQLGVFIAVARGIALGHLRSLGDERAA